MTWFDIVSLTSVLLAAMAILSMAGLIVHRYVQNNREVVENARLVELTRLALEYLEEPARAGEMKARFTPSDQRLILRLSAGLLRQVRGEYAERVVRLMKELGVIERCITDLGARAAWRRAEACVTLGSFSDPRVTVALENALDDPHPEVRTKAARSLVRLGLAPSVSVLLTKLSREIEAPSMAVVELFRSLGKETSPELALLLGQNVPAARKLLAADALGYLGDFDTVPALLRAYPNAPVPLRVMLLSSLGRLTDPRALGVVCQAMQDSAWEVRSQAAICAGQFGAAAAIPDLEARLEDENWWVRFHAAKALADLGGDGLVALWNAAGSSHALSADIAHGLLRERGLAA